jgi:hypothetical protein
MSLFKDALPNNGHNTVIKENQTKVNAKTSTISSKVIQRKKKEGKKRKQKHQTNLHLSSDALRESLIICGLTN